MAHYPPERREAVIRRMLNEAISIPALAKETGITAWTLYQWRRQATISEAMANKPKKPDKLSATRKLAMVVETAVLNEAELAEYCRRHGVYPEQIKTWREAAEQASAGGLVPAKQLREAVALEKRRNKALERELRRKERALAETAALLTLREKAAAIWGGRGRMISTPDRQNAVTLINEARTSGARLASACREIGITTRTFARWVGDGGVRHDHRPRALRPVPANKLTREERSRILGVVNEPRFAPLPPTQIVPILADEGRYLASESTLYRILRAANQLAHRGRRRLPQHRPVPRHRATGPNQLYCWDITYLPGPIQGMFFFLYLVLDVYSRKIVAHEVHDAESSEHAADLIERAVRREGVGKDVLVIHQDNGSPMKGSTYLAKLAELGRRPSYSRPGVSDDNAYAESLFRTCKYRPHFPGAFATIEQARAWMLAFTRWYNEEHKHRNLKFVSPGERHRGEDTRIFAKRIAVYEQARAKHPRRWSRGIRNWSLPKEVWLNRPAEEVVLREAA